jgi:hypothetical protein
VTGVLFGFMTARRQPAGHFPAMTRGHGPATGYAYRPPWNVLERELVTAGFTQAEGAEGLLAWRLA